MAHRKIEKIDFQDVTGRYSSWDNYIVTCKARDFCTPVRNVIKVNTTDSIKTVLSALFSYKLQAVPVYDIELDKYRAFVSCFDIVEYFLKVRGIATHETDLHSTSPGKDKEQRSSKPLLTLTHEIAELDIPVGEAMNFSENNFLFMLPDNTLLREMMYVMGMGGKHRVWIYHKDHDMGSGMVTHTKMIQLLYEDLPNFPDLANSTLETMGLATPKEIHSIGIDKTVLDGFNMMIKHNVQSLAILDKDGRLENQFSVNDVRLISLFGDFFSNLELPISEYLVKVHDYCNRPRGQRVCRKTETLYETVKLLSTLRIHRLFMVDDDDKPITVVSLGDLLRCLWPFCAQ
jgi:5'-AMP-activated protein kinase regulatory gamma subunit